MKLLSPEGITIRGHFNNYHEYSVLSVFSFNSIDTVVYWRHQHAYVLMEFCLSVEGHYPLCANTQHENNPHIYTNKKHTHTHTQTHTHLYRITTMTRFLLSCRDNDHGSMDTLEIGYFWLRLFFSLLEVTIPGTSNHIFQ